MEEKDTNKTPTLEINIENKVDDIFEIKEMLYKHFITNIPYYIVLVYCLYLLSNKSFCSIKFILCLFSWIFIGFFGYFTHVISHNVDLRKIYNRFDNAFTRNPTFNKAMNAFLKVYEFHDETHHNLDVNKETPNIFYEFITNIYTQGLVFILFVEFVKLIDYKVVLLWCFMYATIHNINYNIIHPSVHRDHHINCHTNYGIDIMDILFNTKYDKKDIENFNHSIINLLIITFIIIKIY
jgi:hypothetical protein